MTEQNLHDYNKWLMEIWNPNQLYIPFAIDTPKAFLDYQAKQLIIADVSKSLNADELINSLGTPDVENEYIVKPDKDGTWWIKHKHVGSGEPLKQWLTGKP